MDTDSKDAGESYPRSLVESFNYAYSKGQYTGDLKSFMNVHYLLFRTNWKGDREPPSRAKWLQGLLDYERDCEESGKKRDE